MAPWEAERERRRREDEQKAWKDAKNRQRDSAHRAVKDSIFEYDPKNGRKVYTRFFLKDFSVFNINEESPIRAMRYTDSQYEDEFGLEDSANIISLKIATSDVGYPINVYGTIIARDSIDYKCIYLFHRGRDDPQLIESKDTPLILTGPDRGLLLVAFIYLEIDLNIKDGCEEQMDRQLGKGIESIDGRIITRAKNIEEKTNFRSTTLDSWLNTMKVDYTVVQDAVEATVEFKILNKGTSGKITASTTGTDDVWLLLHDSGAACRGTVTAPQRSGIIELLRRVVVVHLDVVLVFRVEAADPDPAPKEIEFAPFCFGANMKEIACGVVTLQVKVTWSLMNYRF